MRSVLQRMFMNVFSEEGPVDSLTYQSNILKTCVGPQKVYPSPTTQTNTHLVPLICLLCFEPSMDTKVIFPNPSFRTEAKVLNF